MSAPLDDAAAAYEAGKYEDAFDLLRPLARQGNAAAQNQLASMYALGQGVERDDAEAVKWLRRSAEQGYASAQFNLGVLYSNGQGVARSDAEAARWFQMAAEQGIADAQFNLGALYEGGQGVTQDYAEAAKWYRKASRQGVASAQRSLGALYESGRGGIKQDYAEAARWYLMAAKQGDAEAQNKLAYLYTFGHGVMQDHSEAAKWYLKAAEQGVAEAQFNLGLMHEDGLGVSVDYVSAYKWYALAAAQGDEKASKNLESLRSLMAKEQIDEAQKLAASFSAASQPAPQPAAVKEEGFFQKLIGKAEKALQRWKSPTPAVAPSTAAAAPQSDIDKPRYARSAENPVDFALVIGIEKYLSVPEARFAERDSRAIKAHLLAMGYPERNIKYLAGPDATKSKIGAYLESWLPRVVAQDSRVFFYFSGHGAPDPAGKAYLVPWDGDPNFLSDTAYPLKRLHAKLNALKAKEIIVVLDSCFSGLGGRSVLPRGTRPFYRNIKDVFGSGKSTTFTASADDQISATAEEQGHGLFTYYFLKGLNGAAADEGGRVTLRGIYEYLSPRVADAANRENQTQTPQLKAPAGDEKAEIVLRGR
ncbi:MAG: SEL1-like repeat protein [Elusimicrobia bacterium]|nr:SEL1-like repeat protein [Elusimicrobiota bacterium]